MHSSHGWGGMTLTERRILRDWNLCLHPTLLPVLKSVGVERLFKHWSTGHHQVLLVDDGAADEVAEDEDQPLGQAAGFGDNQGLGTARWVSNHPVQLMELHLLNMHAGMIRLQTFASKVTLVGLYQCSLEYSSKPRAAGLCKPPSPNLVLGITVSTQPRWWVSTLKVLSLRRNINLEGHPSEEGR